MNRLNVTRNRAVLIILGAAVLAAAAGCRQMPLDTRDALEERNKALVRRWIEEGFNQRKLTVVDELFIEGFVVNGQVIGRDGLKQGMSRHLTGFPDLHVTIEDMLADGPKVGVWYMVEGTHQGEFETIPPTGKHAKWTGFDLFTVEGDKIAKARFLSDFHGLLTQLGVSASMPPKPGVRP
jgi:steroid delta-isomerase-like uncharacterized protein